MLKSATEVIHNIKLNLVHQMRIVSGTRNLKHSGNRSRKMDGIYTPKKLNCLAETNYC